VEVIDKDGSVIAQIGEGGLTVTPHPLTLHGQRHIPADLIPGESLASFLRRHVDNIDSGAWIVTVNGYEVPQKMWSRTRPKHGTLIECRSLVRKSVLAIVAIIALMIFAPGIGAALASTLGGTAAAWTAAVTVVGSMIINKVLGPKPMSPAAMRNIEASPTYKIGGGRNRGRPYEPIGLLFGEVRITPDYAALPYGWFEGDDQYLYSVFHGGINCASISSLRVGKTPLTSYAGVTTRTVGFSGMTEETLDGWTNVDTIAGAVLEGWTDASTITGSPLPPQSPGTWVTRTSSANTVALQADFEGTLYYVNDDGSLMSDYATYLYGEYRLLPSGAWTPFISAALVSASTKPVRRSYTVSVAAGQYEVRFRKDTADVSGTKEQNSLTWTVLKSVQPDTGTYGSMGRLGLKIKASGQLNGTLDEVNWLATAKPMDYWNGTAWVTATTRATGLSNPGAQFLKFARGIYDGSGRLLAGLGLADSQIDIESLQGFMVWCASKSFTFDHHFDSPIGRSDLLDTIAAAGMGSITWQSGKLGVVWMADDQAIEGVVNMATMKAKTFNVNYQTVETADGIEYTYFDRDRDFVWKSIRIAAPGVTTVLNPHRIQAIGVTTEAHAAIMARFHMGQSVYQRKDINYETDLEHLTYKRMSVMALTHDVTQWGYGGRLHSAVNNAGILTLELDDLVPAGTSARYIGLRIPGEKGYRIFGVNAFSGESRTITLSETWPVGVPVPGATSDNPAMDTIWIYDFRSTPGYKVRVASIQPQGGMTGAAVSVVPESDEFWAYVWNGTYTAPVSQSLLMLGLPVASGLKITEELQRQGNTFYVELTVTFNVAYSYGRAQVWGATTGNTLARLGDTTTTRFVWRGKLADVWSIEVRPFDNLGRPGTNASTVHTVAGLSVVPANVTGFAAQATDDRVLLTWNKVPDVDFSEYELRIGSAWATGVFVARIKTTGHKVQPLPAGTYTWQIKAFDTSGNESASSASASITITAPSAPAVTAQVVATQALIDWTQPTTSFAIAGYEIRYGDTWAAGTFVTKLQARTIALDIDWGVSRRFWVAAYDAAGNLGTPGSAILTLTALSQPTLTAQVIDNNVMLSWTESIGSLPVKHYEVRKGTTLVGSTLIGTLQGRFSTVFESSAGAYVYWVVPVDTASQSGTAASTTTTVSQPPDFRLLYDQNSTFAGTKSSAIVEGGSLVVPVNTTETFATHFTSRAWTTPQDQITAGYPHYIQPTPTPAYYEETIDYGTSVASTNITVTLGKTDIVAGVTITPKISVSNTSSTGPWTDFPGVYQAFATNFRWVKIRLDFVGATAAALTKINQMNVRLAFKTKSDGGSGSAVSTDVGGTQVNFVTTFVDIESITVSAGGTAARYAIYDFTDIPNPVGFKVLLFDTAGARVSGPFSWSAKGV
jgi:hypothetical protein